MQSIVFDKNGKVFVVTKGSDCAVEKLSLNDNDKEAIINDVVEFAKEGLRTMVIAVREIEREYLEVWMEKLIRAKNNNHKEELRFLE